MGTDRVDGVAVDVVAFFLQVADRPVWYRLWVDDDDLVRKAEMLTAGHFMRHRYHAFDEPMTVEAPYGPVGRAAVARFGDPPQAYWQAGAAAARWAAFVGVLGAASAAAFVAIVHDRRPDELRPLGREVTLAAVAAMVATLIEVALGTAAEGGGLAGLGDADSWRATVGGATATSLLVRVIGLTGLLVALPRLWSPPSVRLTVVAGGVTRRCCPPATAPPPTHRGWR